MRVIWLRVYTDFTAVFKALISSEKKQFFSLFVFILQLLYLLPDGSGPNRPAEFSP